MKNSFLKKYRYDGILLGILLLCAGLLYLLFLAGREAGAYACIEIDGEVVDYLPLSQDTEVKYSLEEGDTGGYNIVRIQDGWVSVTEADCRDHICMNQGNKNQVGDTIICLPHKLVVTLVSAEDIHE